MKTILTFLFIWCLNYQTGISGFFKSNEDLLRQNSKYISDINNTIGVLRLVPRKDNRVSVVIYNQNGTIWKRIANENSYRRNIRNIYPLYMNLENSLLYFKVIKKIDAYYVIIDNENTQEKKYIRVDDPAFKLMTWQAYILGCVAVQFDPVKNSIKTIPQYTSVAIPFDKNELYLPVKIQGDWLMVKWGDISKWKYGWIQWRKNGHLLLQIFHDA